MEDEAEFFAAPPSKGMREALLDAIDMVLLPMLDGILVQEAEELSDAAIDAFALDADQKKRIQTRMASVSV